MHTADIDDSTVFDASVGKDNIQHGCGTQLLFNATVNLHTRLSKNTAYSAQLCVSFNDKDIPSGVVYVNILFCTTEVRLNPLALFIDHDLCPVKSVWSSITQDVVEMWKEKALVKRALTPALESIGCKSLIALLTTRFPSLMFSFMDTDQRIYSITKNGYVINHLVITMSVSLSLAPRPLPAFQCCMLKTGRAWYLKSRV